MDTTHNKFFILGLPRSRTYWLSVLLNCVHEGIYYYSDYQEFMESKNQGDSTTAYPVIKEFIKGQQKVIIHRDIEDVKNSLDKLFGSHNWNFLSEVDAELRAEDGLHVDFNDIDDNLEEIWSYCKDEPFPEEMANKMKGQIMNNDQLINEVKLCLG